MSLDVIPVCLDGQVSAGTDLASAITSAIDLHQDDIVVVSQKIISKQEGCTVRLDSVTPGMLARGIASQYDRDPRIVELVLSESRRIVRMSHGIIIVETHHGFVCANAGIDESNVEEGSATTLPADSDASARKLRRDIMAKSGKPVAVLISDTFGRPFRIGQTDCAIGVAGIDAMCDYKGSHDSMGRVLRVSEIAIADELCAAAELVKAKSAGCPVAVIRNYTFEHKDSSASVMLRLEQDDLFR